MHALNASAQPPAGRFATTHWSLIVAARDRAAPEARQALESLCAVYWYPLFAFVCKQGYPEAQAQDLTQEFFARLLEKEYLRAADRGRGRFRAFLLTCLRHFLANQADHAAALKRGGGRDLLSLDFDDAVERYRTEPSHALTAEKLYERRWALALLEQALGRVREEYTRTGKASLFEELKSCLVGDGAAPSREVADRLGLSPGAVKVAAHRLRRRYQELLREEIGRTVTDPGEIEDEIRALFQALSP